MRFLYLIALAFLHIIFAADYTVPDLDYDQTEANCSNVNKLLSIAASDALRLTNYVNITLPKRISKLNDIRSTVSKTCTIIQNRRPSLAQLSTHLTKMRKSEIQTLRNANQNLKALVSVTIESECNNTEYSCLILSEIYSKLYALAIAEDPRDLCDDVTDSVNSLQDYLEWLGPAVRSYYIDGKIADRIDELNSLNNGCLHESCNDHENNSDNTQEESNESVVQEESDASVVQEESDEIIVQEENYEEESVIINTNNTEGECTGIHLPSNHGISIINTLKSVLENDPLFVDYGGKSLKYSHGGYNAPIRWECAYYEQNCSVSFQAYENNLKDLSGLFLNGDSSDGSVELAPSSSSGIYWKMEIAVGTDYGVTLANLDQRSGKYIYLSGDPDKGTFSLVPKLIKDDSSTQWVVSFEPK